MTDKVTLRTERLLLRPWRVTDRKPFAAINADPEVMEWLQGPLTAAQSDALADSIEQRFQEQGWGLWAVEITGADPFIGFLGLSSADMTLGVPVGGNRLASCCGTVGPRLCPRGGARSTQIWVR